MQDSTLRAVDSLPAISHGAPAYHPAWNSLPTILWVALLLVALLVFHRDIKDLIQLLVVKVRLGAGLKLGAFEIGPSYVVPGKGVAKGGKVAAVRKDADKARWKQREQYYQPNRLLMLVHRLHPSTTPGQLYDILLYLVPHPTSHSTLAPVSKVEYYFGKNWNNSIFTSTDRASGFAISTSAYGPFMCTAAITFTDGETTIVSRYVDFEMGAIGPDRPEGAAV